MATRTHDADLSVIGKVTQTGTPSASGDLSTKGYIDARIPKTFYDFGAKCDTRYIRVTAVSGSTTLTASGTTTFTSADVGKIVTVPTDTGVAGAALGPAHIATVVSVNSSTTLTMSIACPHNATATPRGRLGTDDTVAIQAAFTSLALGGSLVSGGAHTQSIITSTIVLSRTDVYRPIIVDLLRACIVWAGGASPMFTFDGAASQQWQFGTHIDNATLDGNSIATCGFEWTDAGNSSWHKPRCNYLNGPAFHFRNWSAFCENMTVIEPEVSFSVSIVRYSGKTATGGPGTSDSFARQHWDSVFGQSISGPWFEMKTSSYVYGSRFLHIKGNRGSYSSPIFDIEEGAVVDGYVDMDVEQGAVGAALFDFNSGTTNSGPHLREYTLRDSAVLVVNGDYQKFASLPDIIRTENVSPAAGVTTADVTDRQFVFLNNTTATTFLALTGGRRGQTVYIRVNDDGFTKIGGTSATADQIYSQTGAVQTVQGGIYTVIKANNDVWYLVNGPQARRYSTIAFASSFTPNLVSNGDAQKMTLTGNVTVNAPSNSAGFLNDGKRFCLILTQDATGGRTATFNAVYKFPASFTISTAANSSTVLEFEYDGTNWWLIGGPGGGGGAGTASTVSFTPTGTIAATDVQGAIAEVSSETATAIAAMTSPVGSTTTELTALTGANIALTDLFDIVDVSDGTMSLEGTDKKTTFGDLRTALMSLGLPATVRQTASATSSSNTTLVNVPGLAFAVTSGRRYHFRFVGKFQSAATTTGLSLTCSGPAITDFNARYSIEQGAPGLSSYFEGHTNAVATIVTSASVIAANTDYFFEVEGVITPSASGTLQLQFRSEINASQITVQNSGVGILHDCGT